MKRGIVFAVVVAAVLAGCQVREVEYREMPDGTRCAVVVNKINGNESAPHCEWVTTTVQP